MRNPFEDKGQRLDLNRFADFLRRGCGRHTRMLLAFSVLVNVTALTPSFHMMQVYDRVLSSRSGSTLLAITAIALFMLTVFALGETVRGRIAHRLSVSYAVSVSRKLFARLGEPNASSQASSYLRDFSMVRQFLSSRVFIGLFDLPFVPFYLILLFFVHPTICLLTVFGLAALAVAGYLNFKLTDAGRVASRKADGDVAGFAQSAFARSGEVRALGMVPNLLGSWGHRMAEALKTSDEATTISAALYAASRAIRQAIQVMTMAWGAWLVLDGDMSGGMIFLASMISGRALAPFEQIIGGWENIVRSIESFNNVEDLTGPDKGLQRRPDLPTPRGHLQARDLVFRNYSRKPVLAGTTIEVKPGEAVIVDGAHGAGKSVLLTILSGARKPEAGLVTLDNAPRDRWPQGQWGRAMGFCGEEAGLLTGTVAQNIARFDPEADLEEIYRVTQLLDMHEQIVELPQGYQTMVSNSPDMLPASLRKQMALARAFYGRPNVMVLDQPTTFLDQKREGALLNALSGAKQAGAAIVMVTRSQMLSRIADRALTLEAGRLRPSKLPQPGSIQNLRAAAASAARPPFRSGEDGERMTEPAE